MKKILALSLAILCFVPLANAETTSYCLCNADGFDVEEVELEYGIGVTKYVNNFEFSSELLSTYFVEAELWNTPKAQFKIQYNF